MPEDRARKDPHEETTHTPEQITKKLREADRLLADGKTIPEVREGPVKWSRRYTTSGSLMVVHAAANSAGVRSP